VRVELFVAVQANIINIMDVFLKLNYYSNPLYSFRMKARIVLSIVFNFFTLAVFCQSSFESIDLILPVDGHRFASQDQLSVKWSSSEKLFEVGSQVRYNLKVVQVIEGQTAETAIENNEPLYVKETTTSNTSERSDLLPTNLPVNSIFAWQVKASTTGLDDIEYIDTSPIHTFKTALLVERISSQGYTLNILDGNNDLEDFNGSGYWIFQSYNTDGSVFKDSLNTSFEHLVLRKSGSFWLLDSGRIEFTLSQPLQIPLHFEALEETMELQNISWTNAGPRPNPSFSATLPILGMNQPLTTQLGGGNYFFESAKVGGFAFVEEEVIEEPVAGVNIKISSATKVFVNQFSTSANSTYHFSLDVGFNFPETVYSLNGEPYFFFSEGTVNTTADMESIVYNTSVLQKGPFELAPGSGVGINPTTGIIDVSDVSSPSGEEPSWKGVKMSAIQLTYPDTLGNFVFTKTPGAIAISQDLNYVITSLGQTTAFSHDFPSTENKAVSAGDSVTLSSGHYEIENNIIKSAYVEGTINQAFFNPGETYPFRYYLTDEGWKPSFTVDNIEFINQTPHLVAPTQLLAHSALLDWPDVAGASSYIVSVSKDYFQTTLADYAAVEVAESSLNVVGLSAETEYQYAVKPIIGETVTSFSYPVVFTTAIDTPEAPANFSISRSGSMVVLDWSDTQREDGYIIERKDGEEETFAIVDSLAKNTITFTDDLDITIDPIAYRIAAYNGGGISEYTEVITVRTAIIKNDLKAMGIVVFPNPAQSMILINSERFISSAQVCSIDGKFVANQVLHVREGGYALDIKEIPRGLYFLLLEISGETPVYTKIIKQ
jgi:hypothetical protein